MDNFMDKLAERYNAQDMIRANEGAEKDHLQSLEDQVEAYEAVLQEMRKLNYRNTELTEKMYALVDESLAKVSTLKLEAAGNGSVDSEALRIEMNEVVTKAVSEAVGSVDDLKAGVADLSEKLTKLDKLDELDADLSEKLTKLDKLDELDAGISEKLTKLDKLDELDAGISEKLTKLDKLDGLDASLSDEDKEKLKKLDLLDNIDTAGSDMKAAMVELYAAVKTARNSIAEVKNSQTLISEGQASLQKESMDRLAHTADEITRLSMKLDNVLGKIGELDEKVDNKDSSEGMDNEKLEGFFRNNEEFMHRESVKVYRNVQAVINDKADKLAENEDLSSKTLSSKIGRVHFAAICALIISLADLVLAVLRILGIV